MAKYTKNSAASSLLHPTSDSENISPEAQLYEDKFILSSYTDRDRLLVPESLNYLRNLSKEITYVRNRPIKHEVIEVQNFIDAIAKFTKSPVIRRVSVNGEEPIYVGAGFVANKYRKVLALLCAEYLWLKDSTAERNNAFRWRPYVNKLILNDSIFLGEPNSIEKFLVSILPNLYNKSDFSVRVFFGNPEKFIVRRDFDRTPKQIKQLNTEVNDALKAYLCQLLSTSEIG